MELNQTTLRGILASILSVDQSYIVPKQGNWYNPQAGGTNPATWCAYLIKSNAPRTAPFYYTTDGKNYAVVEKIAEIELQFVGPAAETLADSVSLWPLRSDVKTAFEGTQGAVMYDGMEATSSVFAQEGLNTVLAWNVRFRVLWMSCLETSQTVISGINVN